MNDLEILEFDEIDSTNDEAKRMLRASHSVPFCIVAKRQIAGRGQWGKNFWSPEGGFYATVVINDNSLSTVDIGKMLTEYLQSLTTKKVTQKPVNDVLIDGKKVAGILVEKVMGKLVIGIGINQFQKEPIPKELQNSIGFLESTVNPQSIITPLCTLREEGTIPLLT